MTSPWLLPADAMAYLHMRSRCHYNFLCRKGIIPAQKKGRHWMTRMEWLDEIDKRKKR